MNSDGTNAIKLILHIYYDLFLHLLPEIRIICWLIDEKTNFNCNSFTNIHIQIFQFIYYIYNTNYYDSFQVWKS